jgi:DinB family protein
MHPQLQIVIDEFAAAPTRLHTLAAAMPEDWWAVRAEAERWSVGECVAHLNLTAEAFLPLIRRGIEDGRGLGADALERFDRLQAELVRCVQQPDGLRLEAIRITSPFNARLRYNLYACLTIRPRHQHRHLWQAEQVLEGLRREK